MNTIEGKLFRKFHLNWPKSLGGVGFWKNKTLKKKISPLKTPYITRGDQRSPVVKNGSKENHQTLHEDAQYYVDVQRQGFFQIGSKLYFCEFFFKIFKKYFFHFCKIVVFCLIFLTYICTLPMKCIKWRYYFNWPKIVFLANFFKSEKSCKHHFYYTG